MQKEYRERFNLTEIEDLLELRIYSFGVKINDLFAVIKIPDTLKDFEDNIETRHGWLRIFFTSKISKSALCHKSVFGYPK